MISDQKYDFDYRKVRLNRFAERFGDHALTVVVLDADVARVFKTPEAVNSALRGLIQTTSLGSIEQKL